MIEEWKEIDYCSYYLISNLGRIKSTRYNKEKILKFYKDKYYYIMLHKKGKVKRFLVHRLVLNAFKPIENSNDLECNHINGNKLNNTSDNLEWCTRLENVHHAINTGLVKYKEGKDNHRYGKHHTEKTKRKMVEKAILFRNNCKHKLTIEQVKEIKRLLKENKFFQWEIAEMFGVKQSTISDIKTGSMWSDIKLKEDEENV